MPRIKTHRNAAKLIDTGRKLGREQTLKEDVIYCSIMEIAGRTSGIINRSPSTEFVIGAQFVPNSHP